MLEMLGTSFTAVTVKIKLWLLLSIPSLTVTVICDVPDWLATGTSVTVRFVSLPLTTTLDTNAGFDDPAVTFRLPAAVSVSRP